jgi:hypothetical protein
MIRSAKRYLFVLPLLFILALSYWRYTYILNPNYHGEPVLLNYRFYIASLGANSMVNIRSIIIYWVLFLLGNMLFFRVLFSSKEKVMAIIFFYLIISFASAIFFTADRFLLPSESLFSLGAIMKNFILSPIFTAMAYIIVEYFHWFGKSNEL